MLSLTSFTNKREIFLDFAIKPEEKSKINKYYINLLDDKQLFYSPIYSLALVKLETLKIYIKINLFNNFIKSFKPYYYFNIILLRKKW